MPSRVPESVESSVLDALAAGMSVSDAVSRFGLCDRTIRAIKYRHGIKNNIGGGRPRLTKPLTPEQQALVEQHLTFVRRLALSVCYEKSSMPWFDDSDYVSCAYVALVCAASRWERRGRFKALCRKWVIGALRDFRRAEMTTQGWAWENHHHKRMMHVMQIASIQEKPL